MPLYTAVVRICAEDDFLKSCFDFSTVVATFTDEVENAVDFRCENFSGFCLQKIIEIGLLFSGLFKKQRLKRFVPQHSFNVNRT